MCSIFVRIGRIRARFVHICEVRAHEVLCRGVLHGRILAERGEVVRGDGRGDLIRINRHDVESGPGERERVAADAASQICHS
jgi:hypothetical protein